MLREDGGSFRALSSWETRACGSLEEVAVKELLPDFFNCTFLNIASQSPRGSLLGRREAALIRGAIVEAPRRANKHPHAGSPATVPVAPAQRSAQRPGFFAAVEHTIERPSHCLEAVPWLLRAVRVILTHLRRFVVHQHLISKRVSGRSGCGGDEGRGGGGWGGGGDDETRSHIWLLTN